MWKSTISAQNSTQPQSLHFAQIKTFHFLVKEMERHPLNFSILTDAPTASNQTLHMAIHMPYRRPAGISGISQKIFSQLGPKHYLLKQVCQSVVYVPKTIKRQISNYTQNWKPTDSTQVEAFKPGKGIFSHSLWDFLLENSRLCGGWWVYSASHWDVAGVLPLLSSMEVPVEVPRLRDGKRGCLI